MKIRLSLFALLVFALTACSLAADVTPPPGYRAPTPAPTQPPLSGPFYPAAPPNPARGAALFVENCAPCHGTTGLGDGPRSQTLNDQNISVPALGISEFSRSATPARWYSMVTQGNLKRFMPPFTSLSDAQRWDVVAYAFSLTNPPEAIAAGKALYQAYCAECHDQNIRFDDQARMAELSALQIDQITSQGKGQMPAFADKLSQDERWQLASYLRSLTWSTDTAIAETPAPVETLEASAPLSSTIPLSVTVTGKVTNRSGAQPPSDLLVTLYTFDHVDTTPRLVVALTVTADAQGSFSFENVELKPGYILGASTEYQNALYGSNILSSETISSSVVNLPIEIYDSVADPTVLVVDRMHIIFSFDQAGSVSVMEIYAISNPSETTVAAAGSGLPVVTFPVPEGATNLAVEGEEIGGRFILVPGGVADTQPVYPGSGAYQVAISFSMLYSDQLNFTQPVELNTAAATVLIPDGHVTLKGNQFSDGGLFEGTNYRRYDASALAAGKQIAITLEGKPGAALAADAAAPNTQQTLVTGLVVLGLTLIAVGLWLFRRTRSRAAAETDEDEEEVDVEEEAGEEMDADTLMDAIIALDDQFRAGQIPADVYRSRRAELKEQLRRVM